MLSLYRLIDINMGSVVLDGVDTASIALDCLRKQLAIIPQVGLVCVFWGYMFERTFESQPGQ
jgi:ABC-type transport system involved in Fe-S cluster assembly fused permease/ATPase subunit